jgi:hypothetical protein
MTLAFVTMKATESSTPPLFRQTNAGVTTGLESLQLFGSDQRQTPKKRQNDTPARYLIGRLPTLGEAAKPDPGWGQGRAPKTQLSLHARAQQQRKGTAGGAPQHRKPRESIKTPWPPYSLAMDFRSDDLAWPAWPASPTWPACSAWLACWAHPLALPRESDIGLVLSASFWTLPCPILFAFPAPLFYFLHSKIVKASSPLNNSLAHDGDRKVSWARQCFRGNHRKVSWACQC